MRCDLEHLAHRSVDRGYFSPPRKTTRKQAMDRIDGDGAIAIVGLPTRPRQSLLIAAQLLLRQGPGVTDYIRDNPQEVAGFICPPACLARWRARLERLSWSTRLPGKPLPCVRPSALIGQR